MSTFYCHQNNKEKMGPSPILSIIPTVTIDTMLNFNGGNNRHGLKNVRCKQTLKGIYYLNESIQNNTDQVEFRKTSNGAMQGSSIVGDTFQFFTVEM